MEIGKCYKSGYTFSILPKKADCSLFPSASLESAQHLVCPPAVCRTDVLAGWTTGRPGKCQDQDCSQVLKVLPPSIRRDPCLSLEGFSTCQQADSFIQKGGVWSSFYIWKYVLHEVNETISATGIFFPLRLCEYFETSVSPFCWEGKKVSLVLGLWMLKLVMGGLKSILLARAWASAPGKEDRGMNV